LLLYGGDHEAVIDGVRLVPVAGAFAKLGDLIWGDACG
jgi:hypothetical protein